MPKNKISMIELNFLHNDDAQRYRAISLFAGAGGCSLGFSKYGVTILGAYDIWNEAVATYNLNFKGDKAHQTDLANCDFKSIRYEPLSNDWIRDFSICGDFTTREVHRIAKLL